MCNSRNSLVKLFTGQSVSPETSWMTWETMTLLCCVCWREATSSVPTWWTGSRRSVATPTTRSPWGSTSSVSRATWWVCAHSYTEGTWMLTLRLNWHVWKRRGTRTRISHDESCDLVRTMWVIQWCDRQIFMYVRNSTNNCFTALPTDPRSPLSWT